MCRGICEANSLNLKKNFDEKKWVQIHAAFLPVALMPRGLLQRMRLVGFFLGGGKFHYFISKKQDEYLNHLQSEVSMGFFNNGCCRLSTIHISIPTPTSENLPTYICARGLWTWSIRSGRSSYFLNFYNSVLLLCMTCSAHRDVLNV